MTEPETPRQENTAPPPGPGQPPAPPPAPAAGEEATAETPEKEPFVWDEEDDLPEGQGLDVEEMRKNVVAVLQSVYDPEIPASIYEMGMIYDVKIKRRGEVYIRMTLTTPACPVAGSLPGEVETRVASIPGLRSVHVELVWDPPWNPTMMSEVARLQTGML